MDYKIKRNMEMKKLLIGFLLVAFSMVCFSADQYAYKMANGKFGKLEKITAEQADAYRANGYVVTSDKVAVYNMAVSFGQEQSAIQKGIIPTAQDKILAETVFSKMEIRKTFDSIIIVPEIKGSPAIPEVPAVPAHDGIPEIPAIAAVPEVLPVAQVTLGDILTNVLKSNEKFATYWADADKGIDITDPIVIEALSQFPVQLNMSTLKLAILQVRNNKAQLK